MNIADIISASRIVVAPIFCAIYFMPSNLELSLWYQRYTLFVLIPLFAIMQFTDFLDGYIARKLKIVSDFGKLFDPFSDVLANIVVLFCFTVDGYLPYPFFLIVLYREFGIQMVRLLAVKKGVVIGAAMPGKIKTVLYISVGAVCLGLKTAKIYGMQEPILHSLQILLIVLYCMAAFFSLLSFALYVKDYKRM